MQLKHIPKSIVTSFKPLIDCLCFQQLKLADYVVDVNVTLDVETIWDAWEIFSIQSASAVVLVVFQSLSMRYAAFFALVSFPHCALLSLHLALLRITVNE